MSIHPIESCEGLLIFPNMEVVGLCNVLKNFLSFIRISKNKKYNFIIYKNIKINKLFDLPEIYFDENQNHENKITRNTWRFSIFDTDKNLDKITDNEFSLMFPDSSDLTIFPNFKNNWIDLLYRPDLFNDIYQDYSNLFAELKIKEEVLYKINNFSKNFNENTISVHLRSWVDHNGRAQKFNINDFYNKIDEFNDDVNNFFISSDNVDLCSKMKEKYGNKIITYDDDSDNPLVKSLIEVVLLSKNKILIGTYLSTFTEMAYVINYRFDKQVIIL